MSGLFYNLGRKVGPKVRRVRWVWHSMTGTEADAIKTENEVGRDLAREIRKQTELEREPKVEQILVETGLRLTKCVANQSRTFSFEGIKSTEPNAFALPGGFIFVSRSILDLCEWDRDETAFILAHEMGHVIRKHAINRIMRDLAVTAASRVAPVRGAVSAWVKKVGIQFLESTYSQELEFQADLLGVSLAEAAGFAPEASIKLLKRLEKIKSLESGFNIGSYFSTHPPFEDRIFNIARKLKQ